MKIIQSYAKQNYNSPYLMMDVKDLHYLNFYSFLLSYITLKKYHGSVTMFTNKSGYDLIIKHIPYDDIVLLESYNDVNYWSVYKVDVINTMTDDFIHVDSDVFIFNDILKKIDNSDSKVFVQDMFSGVRNEYMAGGFVGRNYLTLMKYNLINKTANYDFAYSCGVIGMKKEVINKYCELAYELKAMIERGWLDCSDNYKACIVEEVGLYMTAMKYNFKTDQVLPYEETSKNDLNVVANKSGYTHLWGNNKFKLKSVELIKSKIKKNYPEYYVYIDDYEKFLVENNIVLNYV